MRTGVGNLHVGTVHGRSAVLSARCGSPLCLLTPRPRGSSVWAYTSSLGGGMVSGDIIRLEVKLDPGAVCFLGTQASNKIYRNSEGKPCSQHLEAEVGAGGTLVLAPDPVQCFAESIYEQHQSFDLASDGSLLLLDWISGGRLARGERWAFDRYFSRNKIRVDGRTVVIDAMELGHLRGGMDNGIRVGRFNCLATLWMVGPRFSVNVEEMVQKLNAEPVTPGSLKVASASRVPHGAVLRVAGMGVEEVGHLLGERLSFLAELLDDDPWARKW